MGVLVGYLSEPHVLEAFTDATGLSKDELAGLVGYFKVTHHRRGLLKGKIVVSGNNVSIRHHFTNKLFWNEKNEELALVLLETVR